MRKASGNERRIHPRWRVYFGDEIALGPGKVGLLAAIQETESLSAAAEKLDMSYMRAWKLVKTMNACFKEPLIDLSRGGKKGGSANLTRNGEQVLNLYAELESRSSAATKSIQSQLLKRLAGSCDQR